MMHTLSVSALTLQIKSLLEESFSRVFVEGEISRITFHNSGHIYFTLKDKDASLSAVMFRSQAAKLKFRLEEGLRVVVDGAITLYQPRGVYQLNCFAIEPSGQGALALAYEQLKNRLASQGYFEQERKKTLPPFVSRIALITSATSAALQDMLRVAQKRYRLVEIDVYDVLVQGEGAAAMIAQAISYADTQGYDVLVIGRGGGSIEDLWAFNEECVADAIFHAHTPIISAVGHEIDYLISDFVSDVRAPTPSAAMEILLPDTNELYIHLDTLASRYEQQIQRKLADATQESLHLKTLYMQHSVEKKLEQKLQEIKQLQGDLTRTIEFKIDRWVREVESVLIRYPQSIQNYLTLVQNQLEDLKNMLKSHHPKNKIQKGFAQLSKDKHIVSLESLRVDDQFEVQDDCTVVVAKVIHKRKIK